MGRITVFTGEDVLSKKVKNALELRGLPYTEISLIAYPERSDDLFQLAAVVSVPQVFFNMMHVGGMNAILKVLEEWDKSTPTFPTPYARYQIQIEKLRDPDHPGLTEPTADDDIVYSSSDEPTPVKIEAVPVKLFEGTRTSIRDIMVKLGNTIPVGDIRYSKILYRRSFTGGTAIKVFKSSLSMTEKKAVAFGQHLLDLGVMECVSANETPLFVESNDEIYRLQCHMKPDILNSFRVWGERTTVGCSELIEYLDAFMAEIEKDSSTDEGRIDYAAAISHEKYSFFEDGVCELQVLSLKGVEQRERIAFGLNLYNLMMKYAFIKIGIPRTESECKSFMANVKFDVGGKLYSFKEWISSVVRCKLAAVCCDGSDVKLVLENRIHYAMSLGPMMGCTTSCPFRRYTAGSLDRELDASARIFFEDDMNFTVSKRKDEVCLSKIICQHREYFDSSERDLLGGISQYLQGKKKEDLEKILRVGANVRVSYVNNADYTRNACSYDTYKENAIKDDERGIMAVIRRFKPAPIPANDTLRVATLRDLAILDTLPEERFDRITRMAQATFQCPMVLLSLVDKDRQWFKSKQWHCNSVPPVDELDRETSFCGHTIMEDETDVTWVEDATEDDRFADNPLVTGPLHLRFYAGYPLAVPSETGEMVNIGTLCVIDQKPRPMTEKDKLSLRAFARQTRDEILRRQKCEQSLNTKGHSKCFAPAAMPPNENARLATLRKLNVLDTNRERRFDRITKAAQKEFKVDGVLVSLIDEKRQWFKSMQWLCTSIPLPSQTSRDVSFCSHAILSNEVMWIGDTAKHELFASSPLVTGPYSIRFYAGCPLSTVDDNGDTVNIGTFCLVDQKPRARDEETINKLRTYAVWVMKELTRQRKPKHGLLSRFMNRRRS